MVTSPASSISFYTGTELPESPEGDCLSPATAAGVALLSIVHRLVLHWRNTVTRSEQASVVEPLCAAARL